MKLRRTNLIICSGLALRKFSGKFGQGPAAAGVSFHLKRVSEVNLQASISTSILFITISIQYTQQIRPSYSVLRCRVLQGKSASDKKMPVLTHRRCSFCYMIERAPVLLPSILKLLNAQVVLSSFSIQTCSACFSIWCGRSVRSRIPRRGNQIVRRLHDRFQRIPFSRPREI